MSSFQPTHRTMNSMDLAKQYEIDMKKINHSLFKEFDGMGNKLENYISHVRIIEDAKSPSSRPPANSAQSNKKNRFLLLSIKSSGRMRLHKAKESSSGQVQIGRSWDFDELITLELDDQVPTGFICQMGKRYYWEVHTPKERRVWCSTLLDNYIRYTKGNTPQLINCSVEYFHLENLYDSYHGGSNPNTGTLPSPQKNIPTFQNIPKSPPPASSSTHKRQSSNGLASTHRAPKNSTKINEEVTSLKKSLVSPVSALPSNFGSTPTSTSAHTSASPSMAALARANTAAAIAGTANAKNIVNPEIENRNKLEQERQKWEEQKQKEDEEQQRQLDAQKIAEEQKLQRQLVLEQRRKQEIEKRRQQELDRRKQEELERRKQEELERKRIEELERRKIEELERRKLEELERNKREENEAAAAAEAERLRQDELLRQEKERIIPRTRQPAVVNSSYEFVAKRGPPSGMMSNEHSQLSFEYGDEHKFQNPNMSMESEVSSGVGNYIDEYASDEEEDQTAPLNFAKSRQRSAASAIDPKQAIPRISTTIDEYEKPTTAELSTLSNMSHDSELNKLLTPINHLKELEDNIDTADTDARHHARSRAFSRISEAGDNNNDLLEILEEVGYNPIEDDSATLQKKLLKELNKLQYDKIQTLTQVTTASTALKQTISTAFQNCDHIDPILVLFGVQLSAFKDDVEYIEGQGQGLQVEATNEKLFMNELNDIVHSVEISDSKLQTLLKSKITLGYQNEELEKILNELYNALLKITGTSEDDNQLSQMKALKEKKETYENAKNHFVANFKKASHKIFESISLSLSSKLQNVTPENFTSNFLKTIFLDKMSYLLTLEGLIAFVKSVSIDDYNDILNSFIVAMKPFFENLTTVLSRNLTQQIAGLATESFSFSADPSNLIDEAYMGLRGKKDFGAKRTVNLFSKNQSNANEVLSPDEGLIKRISTFFSQIINALSVEQELLKTLFAITSSSEFSFQNLVKVPLEVRCNRFSTTSNFLAGPIETDRDIGDDLYDAMRQLFDLTFNTTLKILLSVSKNNMLETPSVLCLLKTFSQSLAPTCQEYLYGNFTKLETRVNSIWIKEVDQQSQEILSSSVHCHVLNYVKAYPVFFNKIHAIVDSLELVNVVIFGTDQKVYGNYFMMLDVIKTALNKGIESMKLEITIDEVSSDNNDIDANASLQKHLTLLLNYKWLFEETKNLQEYPKELSKSVDDLRDKELREFVAVFGRQHSIGNIIRLVEDLENLSNGTDNPANLSTYNIENIKSMMVPFKGDSFKQEISNLAVALKAILKGRCYYAENSEIENENSITIGKQIEKELFNNCMFALCQLYINTFTRLASVIDKYYNNFEIPVDKYIINFNFKKNYLT